MLPDAPRREAPFEVRLPIAIEEVARKLGFKVDSKKYADSLKDVLNQLRSLSRPGDYRVKQYLKSFQDVPLDPGKVQGGIVLWSSDGFGASRYKGLRHVFSFVRTDFTNGRRVQPGIIPLLEHEIGDAAFRSNELHFTYHPEMQRTAVHINQPIFIPSTFTTK